MSKNICCFLIGAAYEGSKLLFHYTFESEKVFPKYVDLSTLGPLIIILPPEESLSGE